MMCYTTLQAWFLYEFLTLYFFIFNIFKNLQKHSKESFTTHQKSNFWCRIAHQWHSVFNFDPQWCAIQPSKLDFWMSFWRFTFHFQYFQKSSKESLTTHQKSNFWCRIAHQWHSVFLFWPTMMCYTPSKLWFCMSFRQSTLQIFQTNVSHHFQESKC